MQHSRFPSPAAANFQTTVRRKSRTLADADGYTPEQVLAGALVVGFLALSLFGLVLWNDLKRDCWEKHGSNRGCATSSVDDGGSSWSPGGVGNMAKSQLLQ